MEKGRWGPTSPLIQNIRKSTLVGKAMQESVDRVRLVKIKNGNESKCGKCPWKVSI
jgi:hypothetical protein